MDYGELRIERLSARHDVSGFHSYEPDLEEFLKEDALKNQKNRISVTYLCLYKGKLSAYITLLNDRLDLNPTLKLKFSLKGIHYTSLPALKIGRLCVDDRFLGLGIGSYLIKFAIMKACSIFDFASGCRFVTLDAKTNSVIFYQKNEFICLNDLTSMYLDVSAH